MKAYDIQSLLAKFKSHGLELAEAEAKLAIESIFAWLDESAVASATPYDDLLRVVYPQVKAFALAQADKIDGQVG